MSAGLTAEDKRSIARMIKREESVLKTLEGAVIMSTKYINEGEGTYCLYLTDGRKVSFTSSGDDMTFTSMVIKP